MFPTIIGNYSSVFIRNREQRKYPVESRLLSNMFNLISILFLILSWHTCVWGYGCQDDLYRDCERRVATGLCQVYIFEWVGMV